MSTYFTYFPTVTYNGVNVRDITRRTNFISTTLSNPYVFLPYTVSEGEKPEDIAYSYYGTVSATWVVLLANNIIDPYTQWPMDYDTFTNFLIEKYKSQSGKIGTDVVSWALDETTLDNIVYYYSTTPQGKTLKVSPSSFTPIYDEQGVIVGREVPSGWEAMRVYEYENNINEQNREIQVVEKRYYEQVLAEFQKQIKQ